MINSYYGLANEDTNVNKMSCYQCHFACWPRIRWFLGLYPIMTTLCVGSVDFPRWRRKINSIVHDLKKITPQTGCSPYNVTTSRVTHFLYRHYEEPEPIVRSSSNFRMTILEFHQFQRGGGTICNSLAIKIWSWYLFSFIMWPVNMHYIVLTYYYYFITT